MLSNITDIYISIEAIFKNDYQSNHITPYIIIKNVKY